MKVAITDTRRAGMGIPARLVHTRRAGIEIYHSLVYVLSHSGMTISRHFVHSTLQFHEFFFGCY